ncbi:MAG: AraC family transcriptional regulator [Paenibacillaceae bacterium]|jgi:AraC-like DNA-binding protein|nr:AraC family transcriptional regulator [Paenibacillaceae bacterium]
MAVGGQREGISSSILDDTWKLNLYHIQEHAYRTLDIQQKTYPYWVISFIAEGRLTVTDANVTTEAGAGQVMLHAPHVPFGETAFIPGRHQWFVADIRNAIDVDLLRLIPVPEVVTLADPQAYSDVFRAMRASSQAEGSGFRGLQTTALGLQLIFYILEGWEREGCPPRKSARRKIDERIDQLLAYLGANLDRKVTRETLAAMVHLSPNYLDKMFLQTFAVTPMHMLRDLRLKKVKRMLETTDEPLTAIAEACGLVDASYLTRQFAKRFGLNPGEYRQQFRFARATYY